MHLNKNILANKIAKEIQNDTNKYNDEELTQLGGLLGTIWYKDIKETEVEFSKIISKTSKKVFDIIDQKDSIEHKPSITLILELMRADTPEEIINVVERFECIGSKHLTGFAMAKILRDCLTKNSELIINPNKKIDESFIDTIILGDITRANELMDILGKDIINWNLRDKFKTAIRLHYDTKILGSRKEKMSISEKIIGGRKAKNLFESAKMFNLKTDGIQIIACSDPGINYNHNEDRAVVIPEKQFVAVIDGMGSYDDGEEAALILAEELTNSPMDVDNALNIAQEKMRASGVFGGACFLSCRMNGIGNSPDIYMGGDCKLIILNDNNELIWQTKEQSVVQNLVKEGAITEDQALFHHMRNQVINPVTAKKKHKITKISDSPPVKKGYRILLMSDGISDNLTTEEIIKEINGKSANNAMLTISNITDQRMKNRENIIRETGDRTKTNKYCDGYQSKPKKDNRSFIIVDIKN